MNFKMMGRFLAQILSIEGIFMIPALGISLYCGDTMAVKGFLWTIVLIIGCVFLLMMICRGAPSAFYAKEGLVCVGASWIVLSAVGCLPFWISREIPSFVDAFFEMVSGFTTTGASIVPAVEELSKGILYWRSFSHWLGGMGVLVFCWLSQAVRDRDLPCICSGQKAPALLLASWCPKCVLLLPFFM